MNYLCTGDNHKRQQAPENRKDDFYETQHKKIEWILKTAEENNAEILEPGDLFDSSKASYFLTAEFIALIRRHKIKIKGVMGQHDLRYHVNPENTPFNVLKQAGLLEHLSNKPLINKNVHLYGSDWNTEIPKIISKSAFNILVIHKMIIPNEKEKAFITQKEYDLAIPLLQNTGFDLIVSGDNHKGFIVNTNKQVLINCGSLMRMKKDQINHKPFVVLFDTEKKTFKQIFVPIKPSIEVFDLAKIKSEEEKDENIDVFVKGLNDHNELDIVVDDELFSYCKKNKIEQSVIDVLKEGLNAANTQGID